MGRGPHARDKELFQGGWLMPLRTAVNELSWLLSRGYPRTAAMKLVGDRHQLRGRQREAVARCVCSDLAREERASRRRELSTLTGATLAVDGFNCLITVEVALSGGVVLIGHDGAYRDIASIHGTYRRTPATHRALELIAETLAESEAHDVVWLLDRPVSNSGRLAGFVRRLAEARGLPWTVELHNDPDRALQESAVVVASSDCDVLDRCRAWVDLPAAAIARIVPEPWIVDLS